MDPVLLVAQSRRKRLRSEKTRPTLRTKFGFFGRKLSATTLCLLNLTQICD
ncbi:hypothetical protein CAMRE0001_2002 [Campylobacter rectus RM3267]|uniref:Uncharacterized protein n=1 Tax=Campylobacter rectus RM3267 TaxID=553218 RepID=B9D3C6_CAMRE|nr:hypothetical protein CAMRE0001_2002 [Campylobacter rectus RM3267]